MEIQTGKWKAEREDVMTNHLDNVNHRVVCSGHHVTCVSASLVTNIAAGHLSTSQLQNTPSSPRSMSII